MSDRNGPEDSAKSDSFLDVCIEGTNAPKGSSILLDLVELSLITEEKERVELARNRRVKVPRDPGGGFLLETRCRAGKCRGILLRIGPAELRSPREESRQLANMNTVRAICTSGTSFRNNCSA